MEDRMMKFYSKESNMLALHAMHGHFATSHSHINYYVDVTSIKTRVAEAKQAAHVLYSRIPKTKYVDTIVCMDGTEVVGTFLTEEIQNGGIMGTTNQHETVYVISPEINSNNQMLFRDNNKGAIKGKHVVLLLATTTTGETIRRALECIQYYGGEIEWVASLFGTINSVDGVEVDTLFDENDVTGYAAYPVTECPLCKQGQKIEAMVKASRDIFETIADMGYIDQYETSLTAMEKRGYQDELGEMDIDQIKADGYEFGMDLAFGILEENENNPARVLDIQKYVNRQYESCSKKKFMKVLETLVHAMGNDEGFIGDMYACNKKARNYYLDEMIQSFNFVFDEMCHGTGSAANCDFDVEE